MDTIFLDPAGPPPDECAGCRNSRFDLPITMAFQPIVYCDGRPFAYEALVRGQDGAGAASVLARVDTANIYAFDQLCRTTAIDIAARIGLQASGALLSINFSPNAIYEPSRCLRTSLAAARRAGLPNRSILFEITEHEKLHDPARLRDIVEAYREHGFKVAIDDFGAGFSNLDLLAEFQPDIVKLDMVLARGIDASPARRAIVAGTKAICDALGIAMVAEGVETQDEFRALADLGITLFQGYLFAPPTLGKLPAVRIPPAA